MHASTHGHNSVKRRSLKDDGGSVSHMRSSSHPLPHHHYPASSVHQSLAAHLPTPPVLSHAQKVAQSYKQLLDKPVIADKYSLLPHSKLNESEHALRDPYGTHIDLSSYSHANRSIKSYSLHVATLEQRRKLESERQTLEHQRSLYKQELHSLSGRNKFPHYLSVVQGSLESSKEKAKQLQQEMEEQYIKQLWVEYVENYKNAKNTTPSKDVPRYDNYASFQSAYQKEKVKRAQIQRRRNVSTVGNMKITIDSKGILTGYDFMDSPRKESPTPSESDSTNTNSARKDKKKHQHHDSKSKLEMDGEKQKDKQRHLLPPSADQHHDPFSAPSSPSLSSSPSSSSLSARAPSHSHKPQINFYHLHSYERPRNPLQQHSRARSFSAAPNPLTHEITDLKEKYFHVGSDSRTRALQFEAEKRYHARIAEAQSGDHDSFNTSRSPTTSTHLPPPPHSHYSAETKESLASVHDYVTTPSLAHNTHPTRNTAMSGSADDANNSVGGYLKVSPQHLTITNTLNQYKTTLTEGILSEFLVKYQDMKAQQQLLHAVDDRQELDLFVAINQLLRDHNGTASNKKKQRDSSLVAVRFEFPSRRFVDLYYLLIFFHHLPGCQGVKQVLVNPTLKQHMYVSFYYSIKLHPSALKAMDALYEFQRQLAQLKHQQFMQTHVNELGLGDEQSQNGALTLADALQYLFADTRIISTSLQQMNTLAQLWNTTHTLPHWWGQQVESEEKEEGEKEEGDVAEEEKQQPHTTVALPQPKPAILPRRAHKLKKDVCPRLEWAPNLFAHVAEQEHNRQVMQESKTYRQGIKPPSVRAGKTNQVPAINTSGDMPTTRFYSSSGPINNLRVGTSDMEQRLAERWKAEEGGQDGEQNSRQAKKPDIFKLTAIPPHSHSHTPAHHSPPLSARVHSNKEDRSRSNLTWSLTQRLMTARG